MEHVINDPNVGLLFGEKSLKEVLSEIDKDGDGQITFDEFMLMMRV